jgi:hypothetical protein
MKNDTERNKKKLHTLRRIRNLGWALTAMGGGLFGLPGLYLLERLAVYAIVAGTIVSVGSQAIINEIDGEDDDIGSFWDGASWKVYRNERSL